MIASWMMQTPSLPNWPHPLSGDHLAGFGRLVRAEALLLMLTYKYREGGSRATLGFGPNAIDKLQVCFCGRAEIILRWLPALTCLSLD